MAMPIVVTGGTGTLGRLVVRRLWEEGHAIRALSRHAPRDLDGIEFVTVDLARPDGIDVALAGADVVVHCAGSAKGDDVKARRLVDAAATVGTKHIVNISVVGADRVPQVGILDRAMFGYFATKLASERIIEESGVPWSLLRATQFHELLEKTIHQMTRMPVVPVPKGFRFQPIAAEEVAARLVELASGEPAGQVPEMGGPHICEMGDLVRSYLRARGKHRALVRMRVPGKAAAAFRAGVNLAPDRGIGRRTWGEHLTATLAA